MTRHFNICLDEVSANYKANIVPYRTCSSRAYLDRILVLHLVQVVAMKRETFFVLVW